MKVKGKSAENQANPDLATQIRGMALTELNRSEIARQVGCSAEYVRQVLAKFLGEHSEEELRAYQEKRADIYDSLQYRILESITSDKLGKMQVYPAVVSAGILHDKAALIRGQATSNINVTVLMDVLSMIRRERE